MRRRRSAAGSSGVSGSSSIVIIQPFRGFHIDTAPTSEDESEASAFTVDEAASGTRLDQFLTAALAGALSRSRVQALIEGRSVTIGGTPALSPKRKVTVGETIEIALPEPELAEPEPEDIPLDVLYEDDALVVLHKPAGLVVHPGAGNPRGTLVNALLFHCGATLAGIGGVRRPGLVHRLDKDTSGVMVVAKTETAHRALSQQFAAHGRDGRLERGYLALVWGQLPRRSGTVDAPLGRAGQDRTKRAVVSADRPDAREAITHFTVREVLGTADVPVSLVECELETGRTHQIRVHMAHLGHPLVGDPLYGAGFRTKTRRLPEPAAAVIDRFERQALHAFRLGFQHPVSGEALLFERDPPGDMLELLDALRV